MLYESAAVDLQSNIIQQRKEDINAIGDIMANINEIAQAIGKETEE